MNKRMNGQLTSGKRVWKTLNDGDLIEWEAGKAVAFERYLGFVASSKAGFSGKHKFQREDGSIAECWGSTILDKKLKAVEHGTPVQITFLGTQTGQAGQTYKNFQIDVPDDKVITESASTGR
jgi:hypothetical protein